MKNIFLVIAMVISFMCSPVASAAVINSSTISSDVIVIGDNGLEFVYGSVTSPDAPCCGVEVTLTQGFRLPTVDEIVGGFGTLTTLLSDFNLLDADNTNNIVAFEYFNNLDVAPYGNIGDVRAGYINNLDFGASFYDYAGSSFKTHYNSDFFFVRDNVPEASSIILFCLGISGLLIARRKKMA